MKRLIMYSILYSSIIITGTYFSRNNAPIRIDAKLYRADDNHQVSLDQEIYAPDIGGAYRRQNTMPSRCVSSSPNEENRITLEIVNIDPIKKIAYIVYSVRIGRGISATSDNTAVSFGKSSETKYNNRWWVKLSATVD